jgi:predicted nucleic acid-binding protein
MNGNDLFLDTNIILYLLKGDKTLADLLDQKRWYLSFITELELLGYNKLTGKDRKIIGELLEQCIIIDINPSIKKKVIQIRKSTGLKLPDCIIAASASYLDIPLITADKDFSDIPDIGLILYER